MSRRDSALKGRMGIFFVLFALSLVVGFAWVKRLTTPPNLTCPMAFERGQFYWQGSVKLLYLDQNGDSISDDILKMDYSSSVYRMVRDLVSPYFKLKLAEYNDYNSPENTIHIVLHCGLIADCEHTPGARPGRKFAAGESVVKTNLIRVEGTNLSIDMRFPGEVVNMKVDGVFHGRLPGPELGRRVGLSESGEGMNSSGYFVATENHRIRFSQCNVYAYFPKETIQKEVAECIIRSLGLYNIVDGATGGLGEWSRDVGYPPISRHDVGLINACVRDIYERV